MATRKITVTLSVDQLDEVRKRVAAREAATISGFVPRAVQQSLEDAAEFRAVVDEVLTKTGGPVTAKERAWARRMLAPRTRGARAARPRTAARPVSPSMPAG